MVSCKGLELHPRNEKEAWIITTDSNHVVEGMTDWLPKGKVSSIHPFYASPTDTNSASEELQDPTKHRS
jgi:ribonuclease HI